MKNIITTTRGGDNDDNNIKRPAVSKRPARSSQPPVCQSSNLIRCRLVLCVGYLFTFTSTATRNDSVCAMCPMRIEDGCCGHATRSLTQSENEIEKIRFPLPVRDGYACDIITHLYALCTLCRSCAGVRVSAR